MPPAVKQRTAKPPRLSIRDRSDRDRLLQIAAVVRYRLNDITPDDDRGLFGSFGRGGRGEIKLLQTIQELAEDE